MASSGETQFTPCIYPTPRVFWSNITVDIGIVLITVYGAVYTNTFIIGMYMYLNADK